MKRIAVGVIRKPHGVRGEASVESWTNSLDRFNALRARGFFTLRERTWSGTADLAELLKEREPTVAQLAWLRWAHQDFLETTQ